MSRRALIIIDMLNDFIDEKGTLYCGPEARAIIPLIQNRLAWFRTQGYPVVFVQDAHDENDPEFERFARHCVAGSWGSQVISELTPEPDEPVIQKKTLSSFYGTDLEKILAETGVGKVVVVGVCTSICVMDTVAGLACRGYSVEVPKMEVADFDQEMHRFSLIRMEKTYGANLV